MRKWILFIIGINPKLTALCMAEDRHIENIALGFSNGTKKAYAEILCHSDKKIRFINLRVMYKKMYCCLTESEFGILKEYVRGTPATILAERLSISKSSVFRMLSGCMAKCEAELKSIGFYKERMEKEYADILSVILKDVRGGKRIRKLL